MVEVTFSMLCTVACIACISTSIAFPHSGVWHVLYGKDELMGFPKTMYNGTKIVVKISCRSEKNDTRLIIRWVMRYSMCVNEYESTRSFPTIWQSYLDRPEIVPYQGMEYKNVEYIKSRYEYDCDGGSFFLHWGQMEETPFIETAVYPTSKDQNATQSAEKEFVPDTLSRKTREDVVYLDGTADSFPMLDPLSVVKTWKDGSFIFVMSILSSDDIKADVKVRMLGPYGYLSAVEWPLLVFYGVMGLAYIVFGLVWIVLLACNRRDLLSVHYWIGGVIFINILEKAVFFAEYQSVNYTGESVSKGALIVAEIISCLKRTTARMLIIIISMGFGIAKPRPNLHKVLCVGLLYFVAGTIEGCMRTLNLIHASDRNELLVAVPLAVIDFYCGFLILSSLRQTTRTLRLQENSVKLRMYRIFTFTLIFAVFAGVIFCIWSTVQIKFKDCVKDWQVLWLDEAIWHLLFSVIFIISMIMWRPTANKKSDLANSSHELLISQPIPQPKHTLTSLS